ncbi:hypothetical protein MMC26_000165 [Xylographa opegraphella]|nr:hypothetical protein [Xylographa opegraphella]
MSIEAIPPSCYRPPLSESTNDLNTYVAVASAHTIKTAWPNILRRKTSTRALHAEADSSESLPSSHSSIFEALFCDASNENSDGKAAWLGTFVTGGSRSQPSVSAKAIKTEPASTLANSAARSLHLPTPLETITEQKSIATLRAQKSFSASHKLSFSLDDLDLFRRSSRLFKNSSSSSSAAAVPHLPQPVYPVAPSNSPPPRMPTPPGIPKFNTPAAVAYRLPYPSTNFRGLFRRNKTPEERQWLAQTARLPQGALMRGEDGVLVRGRWRPSQSGHTGNARPLGARGPVAHPLHIAPFANVPVATASRMDDLAHTSSAAPTAGRGLEQPVLQDLGGLLGANLESAHRPENFQAPIPTSLISAARSPVVRSSHPSSHEPNVAVESTESQLPTGEETTSKWEKFGLLFCYVCCGMEKSDDYNLHPRVVPNMEEVGGVRNPRAGYVGL